MVKCCPLCIVRARLVAQIHLFVRKKDSSAATLLHRLLARRRNWLSSVSGLIPRSQRLLGD